MINLRITEEQFNELYPNLEGMYSHFDNPVPNSISSEDFERRYLSSKLWRLNNIYTVVDKYGDPVTFRMNYAQHRVYSASRKHPRVIILKSRQQGISTLWLVSFFDDAVFCPFLNLGLMAQGNDEASTLLERVKFLWDTLDDTVKSFLQVRMVKDNAKAVEFSNKSNMFIRVSFRSATLQRLHISEFGKIANAYPNRARETKTGTLQALAQGNSGIIESTAEGKNMFKDMWDASVVAEQSGTMSPKDFLPVFLSWLEDPDCNLSVDQYVDTETQKYFDRLEEETGFVLTKSQKNFWVAQRRELGGDVYQEYPATPEEAFIASRDGTYYARAFIEKVVRKKRIVTSLYDQNLDVDVYMDLGVDDYFVMLFVQWYRGEYRIVGEYWNNGMGLEHYIEEANDMFPDGIRDLVFPHDVKARQLGNTDGAGRAKALDRVAKDILDKLEMRTNVRIQGKVAVQTGIEAVRGIMDNLWIDASCTYLIDCMHNYTKEWDDRLEAWKTVPLHNQYSHGADCLRGVAMGVYESDGINKSKMANTQRQRPMKGHAI